MGVRGLSSFFSQNTDFFKPYRLHDSTVIIDGDNLIHILYFNNNIRSIFGGDYKKYADSIKNYLTAFLECHIKPIIIFDGGIDISGRKFKTIFERARERLRQIEKITFNGHYYDRILPILARDVFISVLCDLDVQFAVCDYEADDQITALANYYDCPVISADSDFFIYDLQRGFIRVDSIDTTIHVDNDFEGTEYKYLSCNIYHIDDFVSYFPGIDKNILPLFGALIGNDYIDGKEFDNFFSNIQLPKYNGKKLILNSKHKKMIGLLCWLRKNNFCEALDHVMTYLKKEKRQYFRSVIEEAVEGYQLYDCSLAYIIDRKLDEFQHKMSYSTRLVTPCGNQFPINFLVKFHSGQYSSFFINVITLHKVFLLPQIEDISLPSSYDCSCFIRRVLYGILIRHDVHNNACQNTQCLASIEENERQGNSFKRKLVEPLFSLEGVGLLPKIDQLDNLQEEQSMKILANVLNINLSYFDDFPDEWKLLFGCVNYWLRSCEPHCTEPFLFALVINFIYFSIINCKDFNEKYIECLNKKPTEIHGLISRISESELQTAAKNLKKFKSQPVLNYGNPLLLYIVHSYSQLQCCIQNIVLLNKLLGGYLMNPNPYKCFTGTMLYNLTKDISSRQNAELFIAELLGRETTLHELFKTLIFKIYEIVPDSCISKNKLTLKKHKSKSTKHSDSSSKNIKSINTFNVLKKKELL